MRYGLVETVDRPISRIVLGTSGMRDYEAAAPILDEFFEVGGTCLDCAYVYGQGRSEEVVGEWLRRRGAHRLAVLIGKGAHPPECTPGTMGPQLEASLERLGVERVDLYMPHRDDPAVPISEWVDAMESLVRLGLTRAYGVSNWSTGRIDEANAYAARAGARGLVAVSNHFSLAQSSEPLYPGCVAFEAADVAFLHTRQLALFPWSSQARGFFSGVDDSLLDPRMRRCWDTPANRERRQRAASLADMLGVPTINIALAYVLSQPFPTFPLIGPRDLTEMQIALGGLAIDLPALTLAWLWHGERNPLLHPELSTALLAPIFRQ